MAGRQRAQAPLRLRPPVLKAAGVMRNVSRTEEPEGAQKWWSLCVSLGLVPSRILFLERDFYLVKDTGILLVTGSHTQPWPLLTRSQMLATY